MKISIGSDHRGIEQRARIAAAIESAGHQVDDCGTDSTESCDYPDIAADVARRVAAGQSDRGILICGTGIGVSIAANKIPGIRAAVCHDLHTVEMSRRHNDANVLCMAAEIEEPVMREMVTLWLSTDFDGGRHERRVNKITALEIGRTHG
ncbi:MAG: ribose 5-phosphate isomerase B [Mariniblastus sp.]|nr:ribose 5-phosphate isomerase B [Mariniblastus sp.]